MEHIMSVMSSRSILDNMASRWVKAFKHQELWHYEAVSVGGKRDFGSNRYIGAETKYLVVNLQQPTKPFDFQSPDWELVDDIDSFQQGHGISIDADNRKYQEENVERWLISVGRLFSKYDGVKRDRNLYIVPFKINDDRSGLYVVKNELGVFKHMVDIQNDDELFRVSDALWTYPTNYNRLEMAEKGYLTVSDHTSWLGEGGKHVHAVLAYFRVIDGHYVYFSLDTWCGGNHWKAHEHSPKPIYPNPAVVTCKKCLKQIEKRLVTQSR